MSRVYLASPLGFDDPGRRFRLEVLLPMLRATGWTLLDPWANQQPAEQTPQVTSARAPGEDALNRAIGERNLTMLRSAEGLLAWLDGVDLDSGTAGEVGFACARGIPVVGVRTDSRLAGDNSAAVVNLQVLAFVRETGGEIYPTLSDAVAALTRLLEHP